MNWEAENEFYNTPFLDSDGFHYGQEWELFTNYQKTRTEKLIYVQLQSEFPHITMIHSDAYDASGSKLPDHMAFLIKTGENQKPVWEKLADIKKKTKK